jgi:hypothetical protein
MMSSLILNILAETNTKVISEATSDVELLPCFGLTRQKKIFKSTTGETLDQSAITLSIALVPDFQNHYKLYLTMCFNQNLVTGNTLQ